MTIKIVLSEDGGKELYLKGEFATSWVPGVKDEVIYAAAYNLIEESGYRNAQSDIRHALGVKR